MGDAKLEVADAKDMMSEKTSKSKPGKPEQQLQSRQPAPFKDPNRTPFPRSFRMCVEQAYLSVKNAIADGHKLIEVEFPPLPLSAMEGDAIGADTVLRAQLSHAEDVARLFPDKKVAIVFSDIVERNRFIEDISFQQKQSQSNIRYSALGGGFKGSLIERLWVEQEYVDDVQEEDELFIVIGASCQELPDVRKFCEAAGDRPVVLFNLKLQTLRGDLGLPAFPPKSLHYDWLSTAIPAYFVLPRSYSRSCPRPPFLINYSGCIFRTYPGQWQLLLEVPDEEEGGTKYEQVKRADKRPALSEVREELAVELQLDELDGSKDGKFLGFDLKTLRQGVVVKTWWEQDVDKAKSDKWRD
eukprot:CAMPEP_0181301106 /NCGR_PEP_ID=MMETSP1101-20121128/7245_1 /TAXON_ID=46948 /ORGANISM="Rhodomonas abbreviata, Strain Caron Lab Isolate" /LENGTH=354 /DNA_ID=CAMNT_0023406385 /DNA_START=116 /DNA_END=1180 /DNA_ORIENTATION=-